MVWCAEPSRSPSPFALFNSTSHTTSVACRWCIYRLDMRRKIMTVYEYASRWHQSSYKSIHFTYHPSGSSRWSQETTQILFWGWEGIQVREHPTCSCWTLKARVTKKHVGIGLCWRSSLFKTSMRATIWLPRDCPLLGQPSLSVRAQAQPGYLWDCDL